MLRKKLVGTLTTVALASAVGVLPAAAANAAPEPTTAVAARPAPAPASVPVTGVLPDGTEFTGEVSDLTADVVDGVMTLTGTITSPDLQGGTDTFTAPIETLQQEEGCDILNLDLGPLHLDLLGLVIDLEPIVLDITAVPGAGNLLGNLLCAIAGLLDPDGTGVGGLLNGVVALLNRLLTGLGL